MIQYYSNTCKLTALIGYLSILETFFENFEQSTVVHAFTLQNNFCMHGQTISSL